MILEAHSYFTQGDSDVWFGKLPDPNLAAILQFMDRNGMGIFFLMVASLGAILAFTAIWRETRKPDPKPDNSEVERLYTVSDDGVKVFEHRAFELSVAWEGDDGEHASGFYLNFLGRYNEDEKDRPTIAIYPWNQKFQVSSDPAE